MPVVTVELDDATYALLAERARQTAARVEDVAAQALAEGLYQGAAAHARATASRHLQRYPRLFERLAE